MDTCNNLFGKNFWGDLLRKDLLSLERLNQCMIVFLTAYILANTKENDKEIAWDAPRYYLRDLIFDFIQSNVPKTVREAVDSLESDKKLPLTDWEISILQRGYAQHDMAELVNYFVTHFYPQVIADPIDMPSSISKLCISLLSPVSGSFYDGTVGIGTNLISAAKYSTEHGVKLSLYAQEKISVLFAVAIIRAYINGIDNINVFDRTISKESKFITNNNTAQRFDYSVMLPPLGQSPEKVKEMVADNRDSRFRYLRESSDSNAELLFFEQQLDSLKPGNGRGVIAVSTGTLFNDANRHFRQRLIEQGMLECVITLPSKILPYTTTPLSLIITNMRKHEKSGIIMILADELFPKDKAVPIYERLTQEVIDKIVSMYRGNYEDYSICRYIEYDELVQNNSILLPKRYIRQHIVESEFGKLAINFYPQKDWCMLKNIADIFRGINITRSAKENVSGTYKIINYADVQNEELNSDTLKSYDVETVYKKYLVKEGDVIVSCKGAAIKVCRISKQIDNLLLSINFICLRADQNKCMPKYLEYYLKSPAGRAYLKSRQVGTSIITLKNLDLEEMPIILPDIEEQKEYIRKYEEAQQRISEEMQRLHRCLIREKWMLYQKMGLSTIMEKMEDNFKENSNSEDLFDEF